MDREAEKAWSKWKTEHYTEKNILRELDKEIFTEEERYN